MSNQTNITAAQIKAGATRKINLNIELSYGENPNTGKKCYFVVAGEWVEYASTFAGAKVIARRMARELID